VRAPLSWIREFTPVAASTTEIADALNQLGLEVEAIDEPGREIGGVVAARILEVLPHPDADRIRLADVDAGDGVVRVVCGAPNIEKGMLVPFARVGAQLPGDFTIERRKIRGQVSEGMLCSARELGLGDDHAGILELPADTALGTDVREVLGLDDVVFELAITPNRPDAMGVIGVARELAAHFGLPLTVPNPDPGSIVNAIDSATVVVDARPLPALHRDGRDGDDGSRPDWLQRQLVLAGMRPISNVVDVTSYVMLERCRPFTRVDPTGWPGAASPCGSRDGEQMTTLDGVERALTRRPADLRRRARSPRHCRRGAGGRRVSDATTTVLLESAYFEARGIAKTSKRLGRGLRPAARRLTTSRRVPRAMELFARSRGQNAGPASSTSTRSPSSVRVTVPDHASTGCSTSSCAT
jgi:phenylalanyl-tRNA synthetase beta chain